MTNIVVCFCCNDRQAVAGNNLKQTRNRTKEIFFASSTHVLQPYLYDQTNIPYRLRTRPHNVTMINKTKFLNDTDFIIRMLFKYSY